MKFAVFLFIALLAGPPAQQALAGEVDYDVTLTSGSRKTALGDLIDYLLFIPRERVGLNGPPYPLLVLTHGFARDYGRHVASAEEYARHGILVMTPNAAPGGGVALQPQRVVKNTADHVRWLARKSEKPGHPLFGMVDARRIALAGHSAGGAISFEAAVELQRGGPSPLAVVLLDAVPYASTLSKAADLEPLALLNIRSEPGPCNAGGSVADLMDALLFPASDVRVTGATHCDPESPTDLSCQLVCGKSGGTKNRTYLRLSDVFLRNALDAGAQGTPRFERIVRRLDRRGDVEIISLPSP